MILGYPTSPEKSGNSPCKLKKTFSKFTVLGVKFKSFDNAFPGVDKLTP